MQDCVNGMLIVNLDPPFVGFSTEGSSEFVTLSRGELTRFLIDIAQREPGTKLPQEFQARIYGNFPLHQLTDYGLLPAGAD